MLSISVLLLTEVGVIGVSGRYVQKHVELYITLAEPELVTIQLQNMEELIVMLMDLLMLKQNHVQSMELGENGATGKHALHLAMADNKSENVSVTAPSPNMVEMTVLQMALRIPTLKNVTPIDAQFVCTKVQNTLDLTTKDRTHTRSPPLMTVTKISSARTKKIKHVDSLPSEHSKGVMMVLAS